MNVHPGPAMTCKLQLPWHEVCRGIQKLYNFSMPEQSCTLEIGNTFWSSNSSPLLYGLHAAIHEVPHFFCLKIYHQNFQIIITIIIITSLPDQLHRLVIFFKVEKSINIERKLQPHSPECISSFITPEVLMCVIIISVHRSYGFSYICNVLHTWGTIKTKISDCTCLRRCISRLFLLIRCYNKVVIIILQKTLVLSFSEGRISPAPFASRSLGLL